ncbi:MAG: PfkB family carbohydrate kinase, partial [Candidatus Helarchaeota archaeon]|nr:PfkB family carbohydrate kinase [Candidatus Helarchaeota archaeon]
NCTAMGADTTLLSAIGGDEMSFVIEHLVKKSHFVHHSKGTTQKLRVIGKQQQIARIDFDYPTPEIFAKKLQVKFEHLVKEHDIIIFSDYGKGSLRFVSEMINTANTLGKIVLVDPKGHNYEKYRGATIIKPNVDEMKDLIGGWDSEEELSHKTHDFLRNGGFVAVLLTRAAEGMTLFTRDNEPFHVHSVARNVFDVTGAGDVAISAFAVSISKGLDWHKATEYAAKASGLSVERFGTVAIKAEEVFK